MWYRALKALLLYSFVIMACSSAMADELLLSAGAGKQISANQDNELLALDYNFHSIERSARSTLSFGLSYTSLTTNTAIGNDKVEIYSLYPQLTLYPTKDSMQNMFFFVRALGPSYLSHNQFGERQQDHHFTFQAQVGIGYEKKIDTQQSMIFQLSWKHFSNANLFSDNDGIDIPLVFTLGIKY